MHCLLISRNALSSDIPECIVFWYPRMHCLLISRNALSSDIPQCIVHWVVFGPLFSIKHLTCTYTLECHLQTVWVFLIGKNRRLKSIISVEKMQCICVVTAWYYSLCVLLSNPSQGNCVPETMGTQALCFKTMIILSGAVFRVLTRYLLFPSKKSKTNIKSKNHYHSIRCSFSSFNFSQQKS